MQPIEQAQTQALTLYRLAFLLTGKEDVSADAAIEAIGLANDGESSSPNRPGTKRRMVIERALAAVRSELRVSSAQQTSHQADFGAHVILPISGLSWTQVECALLGIAAFPRCALVLRVLEGLSLSETAALLGVDAERIREAQVAGLRALTGSLGRYALILESMAQRKLVKSLG
jgi:DNA-directed RNA polymerase specialized sigma24 family protein